MNDTALPRGRAGLRRREALLRAARELFLEEGYDKVSIDQIVARAGGSKASVYTYFAGKEGLFVALVEQVCGEFLDFPPRAPEGGGTPPAEVLARIGENACRAVLNPEVMALFRLAVAESYRFPQIGQAFYDSGPRAARAALARYLAAAAGNGDLAIPDPEMAADFFLGMLLDRGTLEMSLTATGTPDGETVRRRVDEAVALMMARYAPREG
jgi:TetR/AcrR family transcriptional regulator, mexJK operon transcriptional repressor